MWLLPDIFEGEDGGTSDYEEEAVSGKEGREVGCALAGFTGPLARLPPATHEATSPSPPQSPRSFAHHLSTSKGASQLRWTTGRQEAPA